MQKYESNYEGKKAYVEECLAPAIIGMGSGWESLEYIPNYQGRECHEVVLATNKNPAETVAVNVTCDSISALFWDVARTLMEVI